LVAARRIYEPHNPAMMPDGGAICQVYVAASISMGRAPCVARTDTASRHAPARLAVARTERERQLLIR
jgi:hypothetical protein